MKIPEKNNHLDSALVNHQKSFFLVEFLALEISYERHCCVVAFPVNELYFGPDGTFSNGLLSTIMDITMAHWAKHETGSAGVTIELATKYLAPLVEGTARCEARFLAPETCNRFMEAKIWNGHDCLTACATATWSVPI